MKSFLLFVLISFCCSLTTMAQNSAKDMMKSPPSYTGNIEFTRGSFDGYDYPVKGDSVLVYLKDSSQISFIVFSPKEKKTAPRMLHIDCKALKPVRRKEFNNIRGPSDIVPTNNFDVKFSDEQEGVKSTSVSTAHLTHYSDGDSAELLVMVEHDGLQIYDLFLAKLKKTKSK